MGTWKTTIRRFLGASSCDSSSRTNSRFVFLLYKNTRGSVSRSPNKLKTHPKGWDFNLAGVRGISRACELQPCSERAPARSFVLRKHGLRSLRSLTVRSVPRPGKYKCPSLWMSFFIWQELQNDYRTLIGVTIDKSDVNLPSKISKEEQKNV
jgi:hypothetical protein